VSYVVSLSLFAATSSAAGLIVQSRLDINTYPKGIGATKPEMNSLELARDDSHGEWNTIRPHAD